MSAANEGRKVTWCGTLRGPGKRGVIVAYVPAFTPLRALAKQRGVEVGDIRAPDRVVIARYLVRESCLLGTPGWFTPRASVIDKALEQSKGSSKR